MARGLADVLDAYALTPRQRPRGSGAPRLFVPLLEGDAQCAGLLRVLAARAKAHGCPCELRGSDPRARALLPCESAQPPAAAALTLEVAVERADASDEPALLFLLPGWELRAGLAGVPPAYPRAALTIESGESGSEATAHWQLASLGLAPSSLGRLPGSAGLAGALAPAAARLALDAIAGRLLAWIAREVSAPRPLGPSPLPKNVPE